MNAIDIEKSGSTIKKRNSDLSKHDRQLKRKRAEISADIISDEDKREAQTKFSSNDIPEVGLPPPVTHFSEFDDDGDDYVDDSSKSRNRKKPRQKKKKSGKRVQWAKDLIQERRFYKDAAPNRGSQKPIALKKPQKSSNTGSRRSKSPDNYSPSDGSGITAYVHWHKPREIFLTTAGNGSNNKAKANPVVNSYAKEMESKRRRSSFSEIYIKDDEIPKTPSYNPIYAGDHVTGSKIPDVIPLIRHTHSRMNPQPPHSSASTTSSQLHNSFNTYYNAGDSSKPPYYNNNDTNTNSSNIYHQQHQHPVNKYNKYNNNNSHMNNIHNNNHMNNMNNMNNVPRVSKYNNQRSMETRNHYTNAPPLNASQSHTGSLAHNASTNMMMSNPIDASTIASTTSGSAAVDPSALGNLLSMLNQLPPTTLNNNNNSTNRFHLPTQQHPVPLHHTNRGGRPERGALNHTNYSAHKHQRQNGHGGSDGYNNNYSHSNMSFQQPLQYNNNINNNKNNYNRGKHHSNGMRGNGRRNPKTNGFHNR